MRAGWRPNRTTLASCVAAVVIAATGFVAAPSSAAEKPNIAVASTEWGDSLNHFVVIPDGTVSAAASTTVADEEPSGSATQQTESGDEVAGVAVPEGSVLSRSPSGEMIAITTDGRFIPLGKGATTPEVEKAPAPAPSASNNAAGRARSEVFAGMARKWPGTGKAEPLFDGMIALSTSLSAETVAKKAGVADVREDSLMQMTSVSTGQPNDARFGQQWMHVNTGNGSQAGGWTGRAGADSDAPVAWANSTGAGVVVADVDSGVDLDHSDLSGRVWRNSNETCGNGVDDDRNGYIDDCNGWDAASNDADPRPDGGGSFGAHGTHVGGIIGATGDNGIGVVGMAPDARVMAVKIGTSNTLPSSAIASGVRYAVDNGAKIINASWGVPPGTPRSSQWMIEDAVRYAQARNVLFVAAAGNDGANIDLRPSWPAGFSRYYDNVVTVGASTNADGNASFSNYGAETVDLHAPGFFIQSTIPGGYGMMSGTSMAAPAVSGASALIWARNPAMSAAQVKVKLRESVDVIPELRGYTATGRLNAGTAVTAQPLTATFNNFGALRPDTAFEASVNLQATNVAVTTDSPNLEVTLATAEGDAAYSVADLPLKLSLPAKTADVITDDNGQAGVSGALGWSGNGMDVRIASSLPAGQYALMLQLRDNAGTNRTNGVVTFFEVANPEAPAAPPASGGSSGSGSGSGGGTKTGGGNKGSTGGTKTGTRTGTGQPAPEWPGRDYEPWPTNPRPPASGGSGSTGGSGRSDGRDGGTWIGEPSRGGGSSSGGGRTGGSQPAPDRGGDRAPVRGDDGGTWTPPPPASGGGRGSGQTQPGTGQPPQLSPDPAPITSNGWTIDRVRPRYGATSGGNLVSITGKFPRPYEARVMIGGTNANVVYATASTIYVTAPSHTAGVVDVSLHSNSANLTMRKVYTYVAPASSGGTAPAPTRPPGGGSDNGGGGSDNGDGGGGSNDGGGGGSDNGGGTGDGRGSDGGADNGSGGSSGDGTVRRGNLRLVPMNGANPLAKIAPAAWGGQSCRQQQCPGRPLS